ncbi:MAG: SPOR domain-containing protein [gamma proteobacterium symbiont of Lucinoma myriamae]|nr:SPOR domain-containing protein [gamma proteobacterium symbiont of Lucinoma myriamae]MCU7818999.1 SPOR domain-containing protein [gamma proteobacterium symbiont of Lucinoma myriamae]MCU7831779.1 SPOR domain-containing protein [gamma proteobacterium symbiont of Lucinoma myriamae]
MSEQNTVNIKQRIVGALVLVSLGVIIIPLLLNGGSELNQSFLDKNIPEMPQKLTKVLPAVPQPMTMPARKTIIAHPEREIVSDNKASNETKQSSSTAKAKAKSVSKDLSQSTPKPITKMISNTSYEKVNKPVSAKINMAYTLQIASFSQKTNALALQNKLRKKKFKAYIESLLTSKGRIYRLRVGPYLKFDQITTIKKQIEIQFKLKNTIIVKYKT